MRIASSDSSFHPNEDNSEPEAIDHNYSDVEDNVSEPDEQEESQGNYL